MHDLGKAIIVVGLLLAAVGFFVYLGGKGSWLSWLGHLPGDIDVKTDRFRFYFPLGTCLLISGVISLLLYLWRR